MCCMFAYARQSPSHFIQCSFLRFFPRAHHQCWNTTAHNITNTRQSFGVVLFNVHVSHSGWWWAHFVIWSDDSKNKMSYFNLVLKCTKNPNVSVHLIRNCIQFDLFLPPHCINKFSNPNAIYFSKLYFIQKLVSGNQCTFSMFCFFGLEVVWANFSDSSYYSFKTIIKWQPHTEIQQKKLSSAFCNCFLMFCFLLDQLCKEWKWNMLHLCRQNQAKENKIAEKGKQKSACLAYRMFATDVNTLVLVESVDYLIVFRVQARGKDRAIFRTYSIRLYFIFFSFFLKIQHKYAMTIVWWQ